MTGIYDPALTHVGLLSAGKLTPKAREKFWSEVASLLVTGNEDGKGMKAPLATLFPLPPVDPFPPVTNITTLEREKIFWFSPDAFAAIQAEHVKDRKNAELLHVVFLDTLFEATARALDVNGSTPFAPVCDMSFALGADFPFPPKFPDDFLPKLKELGISPPELTVPVLMKKLGITFPPPVPPIALPVFPPAGFPPALPTVIYEIPSLVLPDFISKLFEVPFIVLKKLLIPPSIDLALKLPELPLKIFDLCLLSISSILKELNLVVIPPKILIACLLVYAKNIVGMLATVIVASLVGTGSLCVTAAKLSGLV